MSHVPTNISHACKFIIRVDIKSVDKMWVGCVANDPRCVATLVSPRHPVCASKANANTSGAQMLSMNAYQCSATALTRGMGGVGACGR